MNAFLGEESILPTNGMRACTAVIIELRYRERTEGQPKYRGDIEFCTAEEWHRELFHLYEDIKNPETGTLPTRLPRLFQFAECFKEKS